VFSAVHDCDPDARLVERIEPAVTGSIHDERVARAKFLRHPVVKLERDTIMLRSTVALVCIPGKAGS
jgi:hypothetical protein